MPNAARDIAQCRFCGSGDVNVVDSRPSATRTAWRRRRKVCNTCKEKWSTIELPVHDIESLLAITYKLDEMSAYALGIHQSIEALKPMGDAAAPGDLMGEATVAEAAQ